jgi:hypothetical protein
LPSVPETITRGVYILDMGLHSGRLYCCLIVIHVTDVLVDQWLPVGFGDVLEDGLEVCLGLMWVCKRHGKWLRLLEERLHSEIGCTMLIMLV